MDTKKKRRRFQLNARHSNLQPLRKKHKFDDQSRSLQEPKKPHLVQQRRHRHILPKMF